MTDPQVPRELNLRRRIQKTGEMVRVGGYIDRKVYDYFFHHVLGYHHGAIQELIAWFFENLYAECIRQGIPPVWDEVTEPIIIDVIKSINFRKPDGPKHTLD